MEGLIHNMQPGTLPAFTLKNSHYVITDCDDSGYMSWIWIKDSRAVIQSDDKVIGPIVVGVWDDVS